jgi:hypothetical protein
MFAYAMNRSGELKRPSMTSEDLKDYQYSLEREFLPLSEFQRIAESCGPSLQEWMQFQRGDAHRLSKYKFWREAFVAVLFAQRTGQLNAELKLTSGDFPGDFVLRNVRGAHLYEVTELLNEEERRKQANFTPEERRMVCSIPGDELSGALARRLIPERIAAKSQNRLYTSATGLVVYVNVYADFEQNSTDGLLPAISIPFDTVWLLADGKAFCIFQNGST